MKITENVRFRCQRSLQTTIGKFRESYKEDQFKQFSVNENRHHFKKTNELLNCDRNIVSTKADTKKI